MGLLKEFQKFAMRGNVVDMAVGVVIGGAFGKIVTELVGKIVMPIVGYLTSGVDLATATYDITIPAIQEGAEATTISIGWGAFAQSIIDFLIIAFAIFIVIKMMNKAQERFAEKPEEEKPAPPEDIQLLREIRDALKKA
ncbi:large-conductance mechanosensitive channel protein MscL [Aeoliella sp.]|uniref:large-conductance mechanosensitive channel protein MscL n=1 Tax=Aeoliella sp. TaxID=2795800 RepID=UPI003CCB79F7